MKLSGKKVLFVIALMSITVFCGAEEKIVGAFGLDLGSEYDVKKAIGKSSLTDGTPMYQFSPKIKFRSFENYYVLITPKTHKIYSIWGIGKVDNVEKGKKEQALIMTILEKKYGKPEKEGFMSSMMDSSMITHGDRYVMVKLSGFTDVTIDIRYYDRKLTEMAEKERIEIEAEKVDSSGL